MLRLSHSPLCDTKYSKLGIFQCTRDFRWCFYLLSSPINGCTLYCSLTAQQHTKKNVNRKRKKKRRSYYCAQRNYVIYCNFANINIYTNAGTVVAGGCSATPLCYTFLISIDVSLNITRGRTHTHTRFCESRVVVYIGSTCIRPCACKINDLKVNNFAH